MKDLLKNCRNPFVNQVFGVSEGKDSFFYWGVACRNPFVNQVFGVRPPVVETSESVNASQSLRKSGLWRQTR